MADLFLRRRRLLEFRWRRSLRLPHQPTHLALLHAGTEHHACPWTHGALRCLRHARAWPDAVLPARSASWQGLERWTPLVLFLGHQHWARADGPDQHSPHRLDAGMGRSRVRYLVRALVGVLALFRDEPTPLAAR